MSFILEVKNLKKQYGKKNHSIAVSDISFNLRYGEILGLLGPNGSGKTTTIQMLLGTLIPTCGLIKYFGLNFSLNRSKILQHVSFASSYTSLPFTLTVEENLKIFGRLYGILNAWEKAEHLLKRFGIYEKKNAKVASLSAGQVTRLMLVKSFFTNSKVVLLDEPTASLDPEIAKDLCNFLLEMRNKTGVSIIFSSHKMKEVADVCDRVIMLKKGKIVADDLPKKLAMSALFYQVKLENPSKMQSIITLAKKSCCSFEINHPFITCSLSEQSVANFLNFLIQDKITYTSIQIIEPSLEDYFLKISGTENNI